MKRRLFNALVALSLILCVLPLGAWLRSFASEAIFLRSHYGQLLVISMDGVPAERLSDAWMKRRRTASLLASCSLFYQT